MSRIDRINELMKREIGKMILLGEVEDPRIQFVTIQSVVVSKDLQHARVKFSILSDKPEDIKNAQEGLDKCRSHIRKLVGQRVKIRYTPEIQFYYDKSVQYTAQIERVLEEIKKLKSGDDNDKN